MTAHLSPPDEVFIDWRKHEVAAPVAGVKAWQVVTPNVTVALYDLEAGVQVPEHSHEGDEVGVILAGSIEVRVEGRSQVIGVGDSFVIPKGKRHSARTTDGGCRIFECYAPTR